MRQMLASNAKTNFRFLTEGYVTERGKRRQGGEARLVRWRGYVEGS